MNTEQAKKYLASATASCPVCNSKNIEGGSFDSENTQVWQHISCKNCQARWTDIYELAEVADAGTGEIIAKVSQPDLIVECSGGLVRNIYHENGTAGPIYTVLDWDIFEDQSNEELKEGWEALCTEVQAFVKIHRADEHAQWMERIAELDRPPAPPRPLTPLEVCQAIEARIRGEFDNPALVAFGPCSYDTLADVKAIAQSITKHAPKTL
jgi:hypothetical protein